MDNAENKKKHKREIDEGSEDFLKKEQKAFSQKLMTKLGKSDLLRLLSILEGELEAQDIIIGELQAQILKDDALKKRYFKHNLSDPFLALLRDDEAIPSVSHKENHIEPLQLLEKVVAECKRQQVKVRHHLALSDAYYKLVNRELLDVKRKRSVEMQAGDDFTAALEKEREKLLLQIRVERAKTRKLEVNYKNLIQLVNSERQRFQLIITMLLKEKYENVSKPVDVDNMPIDELKDNYKELIFKNENLQVEVNCLKKSETSLKEEIKQLEKQLTEMPPIQSIVTDENNQTDSIKIRHSSDNSACQSFANVDNIPTSSSSCSKQSVVTVKRTPTVLEKKKLTHGELKHNVSSTAKSSSTSSAVASNYSPKLSTHPGKTSIRSSEMNLKLPSSGIVSSPTSGAANFALNSPNQPKKNFPTPALPAKNRKSNPSSSFQATRQKFQRFSAPTPSPPSTNKHENQHSNRQIKISSESSSISSLSSEDILPSVQSTSKSEIKLSTRKSTDSSGTHKPQPPKPLKHSNNSMNTTKDDLKEKGTNTPPLPPKKSSITKASSAKGSTARTPRDPEPTKADRQHHSSESISRNPSHSRGFPAAPSKHGTIQGSGNSRLTAKRPASLNTNNNNSTTSSRISPKIPSSAPAALSAQHRLFPPQDGSGGQLLSPVTKTVPKSPLESCSFTFK